MKRKSMVAIVVFFLLFGMATANAATQYVWDTNTVILDHFNTSTTASFVGGSPTYVDSKPGLNQAIDFNSGIYARYDLPGWFTWPSGTIEFWMNPDSRSVNSIIAILDSAYTSSPPSGWYGQMYTLPNGELTACNPPLGMVSSIIPLNEWTHIAFTWGSTGSNIYINGQLDKHTDTNIAPQGGQYLFINQWGNTYVNLIDEFRLSNIARTEFTTVPIPGSVFLLGSSLLGLVGWRRFRKV